MNKIICLWSCPRNISTALMYSFAQREDTQVFDEPLYAHYLKISGANHPAREEVLQSLENDGNKVVQDVILQKNKKILFHKLMTHFLIDIDTAFLSKVSNIIFIRNPKEIIASYSKVIPNPKLENIGLKQQYDLYLSLEQQGNIPIVLDSKDILIDPEPMLKKICRALGIPFTNKMLKWPKGRRKSDGVWGKHWYSAVEQSTSFQAYQKKDEKIPIEYTAIYEESLEFYLQLYNQRIQ